MEVLASFADYHQGFHFIPKSNTKKRSMKKLTITYKSMPSSKRRSGCLTTEITHYKNLAAMLVITRYIFFPIGWWCINCIRKLNFCSHTIRLASTSLCIVFIFFLYMQFLATLIVVFLLYDLPEWTVQPQLCYSYPVAMYTCTHCNLIPYLSQI